MIEYVYIKENKLFSVSAVTSGWISGLPGSGKTFVARRIAEYLIKTKRSSGRGDRMSEEFVCLYNFIEDDHAIETFFDNLSLRVKVVILDNVDPESDFYTKTIKSRYYLRFLINTSMLQL